MATYQSKLKWIAPTHNTDGTVFDESQYGGFTLYILNADGSVANSIAIPAAWDVDGAYEYPLASLGLPRGSYRVAMTVTNKQGMESDRSAAVSFTLASTPLPPSGLAVEA